MKTYYIISFSIGFILIAFGLIYSGTHPVIPLWLKILMVAGMSNSLVALGIVVLKNHKK